MVSDFGIADFYHKSKALLPMGGKTLFKYRIHPGFLKFVSGLMIKFVAGFGFVFRKHTESKILIPAAGVNKIAVFFGIAVGDSPLEFTVGILFTIFINIINIFNRHRVDTVFQAEFFQFIMNTVRRHGSDITFGIDGCDRGCQGAETVC